jgi:GNAT superfamily N-acetyltransferase
MRIQEIITNPPRDEYIDGYAQSFGRGEPVVHIRDLTLKKLASPTEISYGLFDDRSRLVGLMQLEYRGDKIWEVVLVQLAQAYRGQGYGTFFYDYAVMNDGLRLMSDATNTGGPHGSRALWSRLRTNSRYHIVGYDTRTQQIMADATEDDIYDNRPNTRWLALPPGETINESITRIQSHMRDRWVVWYGPGTTTEDYFNY